MKNNGFFFYDLSLQASNETKMETCSHIWAGNNQFLLSRFDKVQNYSHDFVDEDLFPHSVTSDRVVTGLQNSITMSMVNVQMCSIH